jgi:hypothetical protein
VVVGFKRGGIKLKNTILFLEEPGFGGKPPQTPLLGDGVPPPNLLTKAPVHKGLSVGYVRKVWFIRFAIEKDSLLEIRTS